MGRREEARRKGGRRKETNLELMFSEDLVALDFLVGAIFW